MRRDRETLMRENAAFVGGDSAKQMLRALTPEGEKAPGTGTAEDFISFMGGSKVKGK